jgi:hypothetical protein
MPLRLGCCADPDPPEPEGRMGIARQYLRCSSSTICLDIASSSRLDLASQAPCARRLLILGQAPSSYLELQSENNGNNVAWFRRRLIRIINKEMIYHCFSYSKQFPQVRAIFSSATVISRSSMGRSKIRRPQFCLHFGKLSLKLPCEMLNYRA